MKGLFIPEITAEMFRNGCLESIEQLMAEGEIYDIEYSLGQEPCEDCISRAEAVRIASGYCHWTNIADELKKMPSVKPKTEQESKTDYKSFAEWVASEIFSDNWEYNEDSFAEIACRKLNQLGIVASEGDAWKLNESEE